MEGCIRNISMNLWNASNASMQSIGVARTPFCATYWKCAWTSERDIVNTFPQYVFGIKHDRLIELYTTIRQFIIWLYLMNSLVLFLFSSTILSTCNQVMGIDPSIRHRSCVRLICVSFCVAFFSLFFSLLIGILYAKRTPSNTIN